MLTCTWLVLLAFMMVSESKISFHQGLQPGTLCVNERPLRNRVGVFI